MKPGDLVKLPPKVRKPGIHTLLTPDVIEKAKTLKYGEGIVVRDYSQNKNSVGGGQAWANMWLQSHGLTQFRIRICNYCLYLVLADDGSI